MKKAIVIVSSLVLVIGIVYSLGIGYYAEKFQANSSFGSIDISNLTLAEAKERIAVDLAKEQITLTENGQTLGTFTFADLQGQVDIDQALEQVYQSQNPSAWITGYFSSSKYNNLLMNNVQISDENLNTALQSLGLDNSQRTPAQDAAIRYSDAQGYYVEPEQTGTQLDFGKVKQMIVEGLQTGQETIEINQAYLQPAVTSQDETITTYMNRINQYVETAITLDIAGNKVTIPKEEILKWIHFDGSNQIVVDKESVKEYLATLNEQYATYNKSRQFASTLQGTVTVSAGTLGWSIDREAEANQIIADLEAGQDVTRQPNIAGSGYNTDGSSDIGSTYVEVDIANQMMYYYRNGEQVLSTPVVTGRTGTADTVPGAYAVWNKEENATLKGYNVHTQKDYAQPVSYWMPFDDTGQGIHDASWQSSFGGTAYLTSGSLGCINTPPDVMAQLFSLVEVGTPVIIF